MISISRANRAATRRAVDQIGRRRPDELHRRSPARASEPPHQIDFTQALA
jgi:hypothetical protein